MVTLVGFQIANVLNIIKLPEINLNYSKKVKIKHSRVIFLISIFFFHRQQIMPLPVLFFGNLLFGLGGTKSIRY